MKVIVKEEVYDDLINIIKWYESESPGIGIRFLNEWEETLKYISKNPRAFQIKYKSFRHCKVNRFPYLVIFEIENNVLVVFAVVHAHRKPARRYKRN
jgi:plasmid stabilization system protein ParE